MKLPSAKLAEENVLSAVLWSGAEAIDEVTPPLRPEHFAIRSHRIIFDSALTLHRAGKPVDATTVTEELTRREKLEEIGGRHRIITLEAAFVTEANVKFYSDMIVDAAKLREAIDVAEWIRKNAPEANNSTEILQEAERRLLNIESDAGGDDKVQVAYAELKEGAERRRSGKPASTGLQTGVDWWDRRFGGLVAGRLSAIAARPGAGKTSIVEQMVSTLVRDGHGCLVFEKDMRPEAFLARMACRDAGVSYTDWERARRLSGENIAKVEACADAIVRTNKLHLLSPHRMTGADVRSLVRRYQRVHKIEAVFLDHFQLLDVGADGDLRQSLTLASLQLKQSAQESGLPHVVIAQLNRNADEGRPRASHIKECDQLFADSDLVMLIWRKGERKEDGTLPDTAAVVDKDRFGPSGDIPLLWDGKLCKLIARDDPSQDPF